MTDDAPLVHVQDDVHALPAQPGALVEAVLRPARRLDDREDTQAGALGRRAPERQLELDALTASPRHLAEVERSVTHLGGRDDDEPVGGADPRSRGRCGRAGRGGCCPTTTRRRARERSQERAPRPPRGASTAARGRHATASTAGS